MKINYLAILAFFVTCFAEAKAQEKKIGEEKVLSEEVEVVRPYKPILAEAVKLRRSPDLENVKTYKTKLTYTLLDKKLSLSSDIQKLATQPFGVEKAPMLINNYFKLAGGNLNTLLAEGYINSGVDEALQVGAFMKHFSQKGKLPNQEFNNQNFTLFGRNIGDFVTLSGAASYQRNEFGFYGLDEKENAFFDNLSKKRFNFFEAKGELLKIDKRHENKLKFGLNTSAYLFNDNYQVKENEIKLSAFLSKKISTIDVGITAQAQLGTSKDSLVSVNNSILSFNPHFSLQEEKWKLTVGANLVQNRDVNSDFYFFPIIAANYQAIPEYLNAFFVLNGGVKRTSYKDLTDENPYLINNIGIKNVVEKVNVSMGVNGKAGDGISYRANLYAKVINNQPLFVNSTLEGNKFDVIYDLGKTKITGLEAEMDVNANAYLRWNGKINLTNYEPGTETNMWFKPQLVANSNLFFKVNQQFDFSINALIQTESKAKIYTNTTTEEVIVLKGFVDLGLGANYRFTKKITAFAKANNLFNVNYSRFLYYPTNGINIFAGLSYSF